ncbi:MAG: SPOR domain-containing protein [Nitrospirota bacterium]|nr:SPOR domain-containing protein [Nitrospirota bacterium]
MTKVLKVLLYILALFFLLLVCWGLTLYWGWKPAAVLPLFVGTIGLIVAVRWIKRLVLVYRAKRQISRAVEEAPLPAEPPATAIGLKAQWQAVVQLLRDSNLRQQGDPVYVLPWYLVLGAPGSGKSTALGRAKAASPLKDIAPSDDLRDAGHGEWWFLNNAIVFEAPGEFAVPLAEAPTREDWAQCLLLLGKYRKREPLNGLIVTIAADRLLTAGTEALVEEGRFIRKRIDQLMRLLDVKFPVYVMVTKCDLLYGFASWRRAMPDALLEQAMGFVGGADAVDGKAFLAQAFAAVSERIKDLRLAGAHRLGSLDLPGLLFPAEFDRLSAGLTDFWNAAFSSDPYLDSPLLRALLFTSGRQGEESASTVLKDAGLAVAARPSPGPSAGLFLRDLFRVVLPDDRGYFKPLGYVPRWERVMRNVGLTTWLAFGLVAIAGLTISFAYSFSTMNHLRNEYPGKRAQLTGKLKYDLPAMGQYIPLLQQMEEGDQNWFVRLVPFNGQIVQLEDQLQQAYADDFRKLLLADLDTRLARGLELLAVQDPENVRPLLLELVVRRINLIKARLAGDGLEKLEKMPNPFAEGPTLARVADPSAEASPEEMQRFGYLYAAYVAWEQHPEQLRFELDTLQGWLNQYMLNSSGLGWLRGWANQRAGLAPVTLKDFWYRSRSVAEQVTVEAAFTRQGKEAIDRFVEELAAAAADPASLTEAKAVLETWYLSEKIKAWYVFLRNVDVGKTMLAGELEWKVFMEKITSEHSPYYALLARLDQEFSDYRDEQQLPDWVKLARHLAAIRPATTKPGMMEKAEMVTGVINRTGGEMIRQALSGWAGKGKELFQNQLNAAKTFQTYQAELDMIWKEAVLGQGRAYKIATDFHTFSLDPSVKASPFHAAYEALATIKKLLGARDDFENRAVWTLIEGPLRFSMDFVEEEAACTLQKEWEAKVLYPTQGAASSSDLHDVLYGQKGAVWAFADGSAKPFVVRDARAYHFIETLGARVPFTDQFLPFMNEALNRVVEQKVETKAVEIEQKQLKLESQKKMAGVEAALGDLKGSMEQLKQAVTNVTIKGLPTGVNPDAKVGPFATVLTVECVGGARAIPNYNFPVTDTFKWSPMTCGDVTLQIKLEDFTLVKRYPGARGFARFLQDFYDGERSFTPAEFPQQQQRLELLGITSIRVRYEITGQEAILAQTKKLDQLEQEEKRRQEAKRALQAQQDKLEEQNLEEVSRAAANGQLASATIAAMLKDLDQSLADLKGSLEVLKNTVTSVTISGLPTSVNVEAKANPSATTLTVQCAAGVNTIPNYNFPVVGSFQWSPNTCGDTTLQVVLDGLMLSKKYPGPEGFARFLQDFYSGDHLFTPADFPQHKQRLELMGVKTVRVRYEIAGQETILEQIRQTDRLEQQERRRQQLRLLLEDQQDQMLAQEAKEKQKELRQKPQIKVSVPARIAACWDQPGNGLPKSGMHTAAVTAEPAAPVATGNPVAMADVPMPDQARVMTVGMLSSAPDGAFAVQVGAFLSETNAETLRKQLEGRGYTTTILIEQDGRQRDWYTVLIGWDMDRVRAYQAAEDYKAYEQLPAIVRELAPSS